MNIEKSIKILDKITTEHKLFNIKHSDGLEEAIETLLTAYEKEKEKNKEMFLQYEKRINELEYQLVNSISEDKIKAKIEEYKKQIEKMEKDDIGVGFTLGKEWSDLKAKVEFGQSLLKEE